MYEHNFGAFVRFGDAASMSTFEVECVVVEDGILGKPAKTLFQEEGKVSLNLQPL